MTAFSDETGRGWLPLKYEDGPDFCTVTFATGAAFALTVHPERMKLMEAALSASPVAQEPVARLCGYCKTWNSKPCGEQCYLQPNDPVWTSPPASPVAQEPAWRYEIQHGPDGETDWAWVYDAENNLVCTAKTYHAAAIVRASSPPATSAGVGADEIARALANSLGMDLDEEERMAARGHSPSQNYLNEWNKYANAILAFLSRAGVQSNSTQKDGSR